MAGVQPAAKTPFVRGLCQSMQEATIAPALCRHVQSALFVEVSNSKRRKLRKQQTIEDVVDIINAFLNEGQGLLCIHSEDSYFLDQFHQQLDDHLNSMLSDGSLFDENYELNYNFEVDSFRVVFSVKPRIRRPPITQDFKTKGSLDKGLTNLVREQVQTLLWKVSKPESSPSEMPRDPFRFVNRREVERFVENRYRQAKRFPTVLSGPRPRRMPFLQMMDSVWELVVNYISAFSKNEAGGTVFFGIVEKRRRSAFREQPTGRFVCQGLRLSEEERKQMKEKILENVREKLMWLCLEAPEDPVTVTFHPVQNGHGHEDVYVMEVVVKHFHGIVFTDTVGPKAVKIRPATTEVVPMAFSEWLDGQRTEAELQEKTPIFTSS